MKTLQNRRRSSRRRNIRLEHLERRELLAANVWLNGGYLNIDADHNGGEIEIFREPAPPECREGCDPDSMAGSAFVLRVIGSSPNGSVDQMFGENSVSYIWFDGSDTTDVVHNYTAVTSVMFGADGDDTLIGGHAADYLFGEWGDDHVEGHGGDDWLFGDENQDELFGGDGNNNIYGGPDRDMIWGGPQSDQIFGEQGDDSIFAGDGNDDVFGGEGDDDLHGQEGHDSIDGGLGNDLLYGESGSDTLDGGDGNDEMWGGIGDDTLLGYAGNDLINAGDGDDFLRGGDGDDTLRGGPGRDTAIADDGNDIVEGGDGDDQIWGGLGNDVLKGGAGDDYLLGLEGNDRLFAGSGIDQLWGGDGDDVLVSIDNGTHDTLTGGAGRDSFWADQSLWADDTITDGDSYEYAHNMHLIQAFVNGADKTLDGDNLADPTDGTNYVDFSQQRLFPSSGPSDLDMDQGALGDCWLIAGLGAIADRHPNAIRQTVAELGDGTFAVELGGSYYRVDGELPTNGSGGLVNARQGQEQSIWIPIVEKAFALHHGTNATYASISGGFGSITFKAVLGTSHLEWMNGSSSTDILNYIDTEFTQNKAVTWGTDATPSPGFVSDHVYTVDAINYDSNGNPISIWVRNPHNASRLLVTANELANTTDCISSSEYI